jgi:hypothetical protein
MRENHDSEYERLDESQNAPILCLPDRLCVGRIPYGENGFLMVLDESLIVNSVESGRAEIAIEGNLYSTERLTVKSLGSYDP